MPELTANERSSRLLTEQSNENLRKEVLSTALEERPALIGANLEAVNTFLHRAINMIRVFEEATHGRHPEIHTDTDVIYVDSGPGPYDYDMLEPGKSDLDDVSYHKFPWSRKMDRVRTRAAYALAGMVTAKRIEEQAGVRKSPRDLSSEDFEEYGPYLMYTSTVWQNSHIRHVHSLLKKAGLFKIPDSKLVMYSEFTTPGGERKQIIHTEDQVEGFHFPANPDGSPPRRVAIVSHPAHLMRILHILGKYPNSIPERTIVQPFPIPTPTDAVIDYARAELLGTLGTVFGKNRATLTPYDKYQL